MKNKVNDAKSLQATSLCYYSIAKFILQVLLTFLKVKKTKHEYFNFVHLLSFFFLHQAELKNYMMHANIIPTERLLSNWFSYSYV